MKIVAGLGSVEDYEAYVKAGADEVFIGFEPDEWQKTNGLETPLHRREVCYYHVQIGSESELEILAELVKQHGVPVTIAINGLHYRPDQFSAIEEVLNICLRYGFSRVIVADMALIVYLMKREIGARLHIHVSGELGEMNEYLLQELAELGVDRVIFHRKVSIDEMDQMIQRVFPRPEYEAFVLNENCHFHGGYCNSLHCDELVPMCRMPYRFEGQTRTELNDQVIGWDGCGLCALWHMKQSGMDYVKIVGRGASPEYMLRCIETVKKALQILECSKSKMVYCRAMKQQLFYGSCSENCYYPEEKGYQMT